MGWLMFDLSLIRDLTELIGKNLKFSEIESIGKYFFKDFSSHRINNIPDTHTISSLAAAKTLVHISLEKNKIEDLIKFIIELDGNLLNGVYIKIEGLENFLYSLTRSGFFYDFKKKKLVSIIKCKDNICNWGSLINGREYNMIIASIDICKSSELFRQYKQSIIEKIYLFFFEFIKNRIDLYDGKIWSWAGDGGIAAFRTECGINKAISALMDIVLTLPIVNSYEEKPTDLDLSIRIAANMGKIKFSEDTGKIVSDVINYATHLEKKATETNSICITEEIFDALNKNLSRFFEPAGSFEGKNIYKINYININNHLCKSSYIALSKS